MRAKKFKFHRPNRPPSSVCTRRIWTLDDTFSKIYPISFITNSHTISKLAVSVYGRFNSELDNSPETGKIPPFQNQLPGATHEQTRTDSNG